MGQERGLWAQQKHHIHLWDTHWWPGTLSLILYTGRWLLAFVATAKHRPCNNHECSKCLKFRNFWLLQMPPLDYRICRQTPPSVVASRKWKYGSIVFYTPGNWAIHMLCFSLIVLSIFLALNSATLNGVHSAGANWLTVGCTRVAIAFCGPSNHIFPQVHLYTLEPS